MTAHTGQTLAADNAVVAGAVAHSAQTQNETIAMLLQFKAMSNELRKEVNKNTVSLGVAQGEAEKDFYDTQANTDRVSGAMTITSGALSIGGAMLAEKTSGNDKIGGQTAGKDSTLNDGITKESKIIDDCDKEGIRLANKKSQAVLTKADANKPAGVAVSEHAEVGDASENKAIDEEIKTNNAKKKDAEAALRSYEDRKSSRARRFQGISDAASQIGKAVDSFNSASNSEAQAKNKRDEVLTQSTNSMNQNVWKGFDTQNDTMASEITSTLQTYGQAMVQANTHFRG